MGVLDHPKMNTSAQEYRAQQQHMQHGVEGNTKPHTGPNAFAAMKQDEARKQSTTTPQALGQGNRAVTHEATGYPEGGSSTVTGPGRRKGTTEEGGRQQSVREGSRPQHNKNSNQESPTTPKAAHKGQREDNRKRRQKHQQKNTTQRSHSKRGTKEKTKNKQRARKTRPKTSKNRSPGGGQDHEKASKKAPTKQQQVGADH